MSSNLAALPHLLDSGIIEHGPLAPNQRPIVDATTDDEAMAVWLRAKAHGSAETERAYRREGIRWRAWLDHCRPGARLNEATLTDGQDFVAWLGRPTLLPASTLERWGMTRQPINSALGPAALGQAISILSGLYATLQGVRGPGGHPFAQFDPFAIAKGPVKKQSRLARLTRTGAETALPQPVFHQVLAQVEALPRKLPKDIEVYWRTWWAIRLCYFSLFRRSEVVGGLMGDFQKTQEGWVLHVVGKGSKPAALPVLPPLLEALQTYRRAMGLPPLPSPHEQTPIVFRTSPKKGLVAVSPSTVYRDMTNLFRETADRLDDSAQTHEAAHLRAATVHTLRHTGVTHLLDAGADPRYVQSLARHGSLTTTSGYDHREERALRIGLETAAQRLLVASA